MRHSLLTAFPLVLALSVVPGCHHQQTTVSKLEELRKAAEGSSDPKRVEQWYQAELLLAGGTAKGAEQARQRLEQLGSKSIRAHFLRGIDDSLHGRLRSAPNHFMDAAAAARESQDEPRAELFAWAAVHAAIDLKRRDPEFWKTWGGWVKRSIEEPLHLGWRARGELVDLWSREAARAGESKLEERSASAFGCVSELRLAGPFGHGAERDAVRSFPPEQAGPWPARWAAEPGIGVGPRVQETERHGCFFEAKGEPGPGIYYVETFLDLPQARELVIAVQGSLALLVDDQLVNSRDPREWGVWPRFGTQVRLEAGRHRVVARVGQAGSSIRVLSPDGRPSTLTGSTDARASYSIVPPERRPDPNVLSPFIGAGDVREPEDPLVRYAAATLAEVEGQSDVANVLVEPLLADLAHATAPALLLSARFTEHDPAFPESQTRDLVHALHEKALERDPSLWEPALALALWDAERSGPKDAVTRLEQLAARFPEVSGMLGALTRLYRQLGWSVERNHALERLEQSFGNDDEALRAGVEVHDDRGEWAKADALVQRILTIDPESEIALTRALGREDYRAAIKELERLHALRPERKDITPRIQDVLVRAGDPAQALKELAASLKKDPKDAGVRLSLADHALAQGQVNALSQAIVSSIQSGAPTTALSNALDLVEGMTELEHFRLPGAQIISEFEASGKTLPGTAARVLDYSAFWIHPDASSRMLEHEIVRIQSAEAIREFAEYDPPDGLMLHLRVIKKDGSIYEPEFVAGKPTVTLPHLEIGDYLETEVVMSLRGDDQRGQSYLGPTWFFREPQLAYHRSELVVISPESRPLTIEKRAGAPEPQVEKRDGLVIRRWRVDGSQAAPQEPFAAPGRETLPNVRVGWGGELPLMLRGVIDATFPLTPVDPRVTRVARRIVQKAAKGSALEKARLVYHFVLNNIEEGEEADGRRVVLGRHGNRWRAFIELCRCLGIPVEYAVARNRLTPDAAGPFDRASEFAEPVLFVNDGAKGQWVTVGDKYAPFGYVPAEIRGSAAYRLGTEPPQLVRVDAADSHDSFDTVGKGTLAADGSATLELEQAFTGKLAIALRNVLAQAPEAQLRTLVEGRLLGRALQGARVVSFTFEHKTDLDQPLILKSKVEVPELAQVRSASLALLPPFSPNLRGLASLPARETPMVLGDASEQRLSLRLTLPPGAKVAPLAAKRSFKDAERLVEIGDHLEGTELVLERSVRMPAGRVAVSEYPRFEAFTRGAGDALSAVVRIELAKP